MRTTYQIQVRVNTGERANRLLIWLKDRGLTTGRKAFETIIKPFASEEHCYLFEAWSAWDLLRTTQRRVARPGWNFEISSFEPIFMDAKGNAQ